MSEASEDRAYYYGMQAENLARVHLPQEIEKDTALLEVTGAAIALKAAERERFRALRVAAERRREAIAAGATGAEIQAAVRAGHEEDTTR